MKQNFIFKKNHQMMEKSAVTGIYTDALCIHMHFWHFKRLIQVSGLHWCSPKVRQIMLVYCILHLLQ